MISRLFLCLLALAGHVMAQRCPSFKSGRHNGSISIGVYAQPALHHFQGDIKSPDLPEQISPGLSYGTEVHWRFSESFTLMTGLGTFRTRQKVTALPYRGLHETRFIEAPVRAAFYFPDYAHQLTAYLATGFSLLWAKTLSGPSGRPLNEYTFHYFYSLWSIGIIKPLSQRFSFLLEVNFHYAIIVNDAQKENKGYLEGSSYIAYNQLYGLRIGLFYNLPGKRKY